MELAYFAVINLLALALMGFDKHQARADGRRVAERTLFLTAFIGGSVGAIAGMYLFRHKTKHLRFVIGLPVILLIQLITTLLLTRTF